VGQSTRLATPRDAVVTKRLTRLSMKIMEKWVAAAAGVERAPHSAIRMGKGDGELSRVGVRALRCVCVF
jgi:hypothetical protein